MSLLKLLYNLKGKKVLIWKKDADSISCSFDSKYRFSDYFQKGIKQYKKELLEVLSENNSTFEGHPAPICFQYFIYVHISHLELGIWALGIHSCFERDRNKQKVQCFLQSSP